VIAFFVHMFISKTSGLSTCTCFESCPPLVNGWRQWRVVQCCAERSAGNGTKYRSHVPSSKFQVPMWGRVASATP